ncbi:hypothetical protein [Secundilactobacillus pentosiphilus]|uniref:hypothetical protein n=1 Tax=Secundilactobacillus pentosiphilus TaxID=1714682 RepID=UPI000B5C58D4|nr:hypothetical protein [Secundilactobacillus pentosiphilus]
MPHQHTLVDRPHLPESTGCTIKPTLTSMFSKIIATKGLSNRQDSNLLAPSYRLHKIGRMQQPIN